MPEQGILEFDFVYLVEPPREELTLSKEAFEQLLSFLKTETTGVGRVRALRSIADQIALNSEQLSQILDLSEGSGHLLM